MKKLNENYNMQEIRLDLTAIAKDDNSVDFNDLADTFQTMGAEVDHGDNGHVIMVLTGLSRQKVESVLNSVVRLGAKESYFVQDGDYMEAPEDIDFPDYDDVDEGEEVEETEVLDEDLSVEHDEILHRCVNALQKALIMKKIYNEDDIEDNLDELMSDIVRDPDELTDDEYDELADILHEAWNHVDWDIIMDDLDDEDDAPRFEKTQKAHHMNLMEKRKGCCPGKSLNERLKAFKEKDQKKVDGIEKSVKEILNDINSSTIGAHEAREAFKKLKAENAKLSKIEKEEGVKFNVFDIAGVKKALKDIKKADPDNKELDKFQKQLIEKVNANLLTGRAFLYENVRYNGKSFKDMSVFELRDLQNKVLAEKKALSETIKNTLNESDFTATTAKLEKKNQLLEFIDNELTYRIIRQRCLNHINEDRTLNEDGGEITDEELANLFGPAQGEEQENKDSESDKENVDNADATGSEESPEESPEESSEEVELSRIEITLKNMEAAEDLKQACIDAEIPEDAIELEEVSEDDEEEEESESDDNDESEEGEDEESENANESLYYGNISKLLFEGEEPAEDAEGDDSEESEEDAEGEEENSESEENAETDEEGEEKQVKFILTDTQYAYDLLKVLDDQYGISKEEFEEMIGGVSIVEQEEEEDEEATEDNEKSDENSESGEEDNKEKEEEIDPADLFKGL